MDEEHGSTMPVQRISAQTLESTEPLKSSAKVEVDEPSDSEEDDDNEAPVPRRSVHTSVFKSWMVQQVKSEITKKPKDASAKFSQQKILSVGQIMGQHNPDPIVHDPREYQLELFERAREENTIAVLDTGTGKTLIAVLLLRHILDQELEDRLQGQEHRTAFFLVPSVNLVFQQHAVLESNLDHPVARVHGGLKPDLWTKEEWAAIFTAHKAVICTAEVLKMCLEHGYVEMQHINLLIFDEAHHAKLRHAYSRILNEHYAALQALRKPRIFGMTASPVDIKANDSDVLRAAMNLEANLHSKITTTTNLAPLQYVVYRPTERVVTYSAPTMRPESALCQEIRSRFLHLPTVPDMVKKAEDISMRLGPWCGDLYWKCVFKEKIDSKSDAILNRFVEKKRSTLDSAQREADVIGFRHLLALVSSTELLQPTRQEHHASAKLIALHDSLREFFNEPNDGRCIVFVEERITALLLMTYFRTLKDLYIDCDFLIGAGASDAGISLTVRQQVLAVLKFRKGESNCIFATSVAEEGLDIASCNIIIRFDPCKTMIQYVQSRGRARHQNSHLIHMVENENRGHMNLLAGIQRAEQLMRSFCTRIPDDRKLSEITDELELPGHAGAESYRDISTGAILTLSNSMRILAQYLAALPHGEEQSVQPSFAIQVVPDSFRSEVVLPECSPVRGMQGRPKRRKAWARFSAAYETCRELIRQGLLNAHLMPTYKEQRKVLRSAALALNLRSSSQYEMRGKPNWLRDGVPSKPLLCVLISFEQLERPCQSLILISRREPLKYPSFPIFLNSGLPSNVCIQSCNSSLNVSDGELQLLTRFTLRLFKDVFNKTYEEAPQKMPYWIAPAVLPAYKPAPGNITPLVDWETMATSCEGEPLPWDSKVDSSILIDKFLVDPFHGGKRYFTKRLATHLSPDDPDPSWNGKGQAPSILQTSVSLWKKSKSWFQPDPNQPVLEADKVLHRRNLLAPPDEQERNMTTLCFICPQTLRISRVPPTVVTSCYAIPAIIHRIESHLIAQEACQLLELDVEPSLALEAITKDSDTPGDTEDFDPRFHHGMGKNYERLEFLGDTFLKMATTIAVYVRNPQDSEHEFHVKRMLQLCNQNLYNVAEKKKLYEFIRTKPFSRNTWYPKGIKLLEGKGVGKDDNNKLHHALGKKTIADVCEALIGAAFLSHNKRKDWKPSDWTEAIRAVTSLVESEQHNMLQWADYAAIYQVPRWQFLAASAAELDLARKVQHEHGYIFRNARLLHSAFTHPSLPQLYEKVPSYQQLEFLGDALLDMACVTHLIYEYPDKDPQWLTEHKMAMAANAFLGALCIKLGFHKHLRHGTSSLGAQIMEYVVDLEEAEKAAQGSPDYWMSVKDPPKSLADIVEAYVGAMFLDSGFDYGTVVDFFNEHIHPFFHDMDIYDTFANNHPVMRLEKRLNGDFGCRSHRLMVEEVPGEGSDGEQAMAGVVIHAAVIGGDYSQSSRYAKNRCALKALEELSELSVAQFQRKFGCECANSPRA